MRALVRLGDKTTHGGEVISASGSVMYGKPIALVGDKVSCPKKDMVSIPFYPAQRAF